MKNNVLPAFKLYAHWLHQSLASCLAIARIYVNMFAPQTMKAVVSVTTAFHNKIALFADEVFFGTLEFLCHRDSVSKAFHSILYSYSCIIWSEI